MPALAKHAEWLISNGHSHNTRRVYSSTQKQYIKFCETNNLVSVPASEEVLLLYIAHLHMKGLCSSSVKVYLAAVRALHVFRGYSNPLQDKLRLKLALSGFGNNDVCKKEKMPITFSVLRDICKVLSQSYDDVMIQSAICLGFFGCLRVSEFTQVQDNCLNMEHVVVEQKPFKRLIVTLVKTKTSKQPVNIYIGCSGIDICAVCVTEKYKNIRHVQFGPYGPFYIFIQGLPLSKQIFIKQLKLLMVAAGYDAAGFTGHSLRVGMATSMSQSGFQDWEIKCMGQWKSSAYTRYIKPSPEYLSQFAKRITQDNMV